MITTSVYLSTVVRANASAKFNISAARPDAYLAGLAIKHRR